MPITTGPRFARQKVLDGATVAVEKAARAGRPIAVTLEAARLLKDHPACKLSIADIETELIRLAVQRGVTVELLGDDAATG